jgi:hypothetical protein
LLKTSNGHACAKLPKFEVYLDGGIDDLVFDDVDDTT